MGDGADIRARETNIDGVLVESGSGGGGVGQDGMVDDGVGGMDVFGGVFVDAVGGERRCGSVVVVWVFWVRGWTGGERGNVVCRRVFCGRFVEMLLL